MQQYIIVDNPPQDTKDQMPGYVANIPMEGWIFTWLLSRAERFSSEEEAWKVIQKHYPGSKNLTVNPIQEKE